MLEPGLPIKANLKFKDVTKIVSELYDIKVEIIKELDGYDDKNYHLSTGNSDGIILKIINLTDSNKPEIFEAQSLLLVHLVKHGILCPTPVRTKHGKFFEKYKLESGDHIVRALKCINGTVLCKVPWTTDLFYQIGESAAHLDNAMKNFYHPAYKTYKSVWFLESVPQILQFLSAVKDPERKKLVTSIVEEFKQKMLPASKTIQRGLIHGDLNESNIIVGKNNKDLYEVKGIIDYGDCHIGCYLYELAITMAYIMVLANDVEAGGYVFAGYSSIRPVSKEECSLIKLCAVARLCQSLVLGAYSYQQDPDNTYILTTSAYGWQLLEKLWREPDQQVLKIWEGILNQKVNKNKN